MNTLFGPNILSPSPTPAPRPKTNPFELSFSSSAAPSSSVSTQNRSPPQQNEVLTTFSSQIDEGDTSHQQSRGERYGRKGNPKVVFMGMRRSGKSSIQKVIFEKFSPAETLYLEPTTRVETATMESFMKFESAELPFNLPLLSPDFDHEPIFATAGAIIWILDMQDEYFHSISQLIQTACFLLSHYPRLNFEVFIHKTDGLSEEYKYDTYRDVRQRVQDELADAGFADRGVAFYQTSIFDHSVYEAMSKIIQKLLPQLPAMEALLNKLCATCRIQKAYLFDTVSKIYLATDASPTFLKDYEVCSDYVDVIVDIKQIYGWEGSREGSEAVGESLISLDKGGGNNNTYIYAREINEFLSLICVMGQGSGADKRVVIDYNVSVLHEALVEVFRV